jgi:hypothetical protein
MYLLLRTANNTTIPESGSCVNRQRSNLAGNPSCDSMAGRRGLICLALWLKRFGSTVWVIIVALFTAKQFALDLVQPAAHLFVGPRRSMPAVCNLVSGRREAAARPARIYRRLQFPGWLFRTTLVVLLHL